MKTNERQVYEMKITLAGTYNQGKTSLISRQVLDKYSKDNYLTIGCDFMKKKYILGNIQVTVALWDQAGSQRFKFLSQKFYKNSQAVLVCFDISDKKSFLQYHVIMNELKSYDLQKCTFYLIGCKSDLEPQIQLQEILKFCESFNLTYFQTSAKQNYGVHEAFTIIVNEAYNKNFLKPQQKKINLKKNNMQKKFYCF